MDRDQKKKMMVGAGISAFGLGGALLLGAFNVIDVEFMSAGIVAFAGFLTNLIYVIFKGADSGGK